MRQDEYNRWLAAEVQAAIDDPRPSIHHEDVMAAMDEKIARLNEQSSSTKHTTQQTP